MMTDPNQGPASSGFEEVARRIGTFGGKAEAEIRQIIARLNNEVVPELRRHSFTALRRAGEQLIHLADQLEQRPKGQ